MADDALSMFTEGLCQLGLSRDPIDRVPQGSGEITFPPAPLEDAINRVPTAADLTPIERAQESLLQQFLYYRQELLDWNTRVNLTAITDPGEVLIKHFLDSLSLLSAYDKPHSRLLDIGSGAGFPGLPLKIVRPAWQMVLFEATGKKVNFLQHMIETLQLQDIVAVHGRAEELARKAGYRASFDLVTARAVASLPTLLEYAAPFCRVGGQIILPKKGHLAGELVEGERAARQVGAVLKDDVAVRLPGLDDGRRLLVWEQVRKCPAQYPRSGAAIAKKPL